MCKSISIQDLSSFLDVSPVCTNYNNIQHSFAQKNKWANVHIHFHPRLEFFPGCFTSLEFCCTVPITTTYIVCTSYKSHGSQCKTNCEVCKYSWIGHRLQAGLTLAFLLWPSDFKSKTSFGFLSPNYTQHVFWVFSKVEKWARAAENGVFGDFSEHSIVFR